MSGHPTRQILDMIEAEERDRAAAHSATEAALADSRAQAEALAEALALADCDIASIAAKTAGECANLEPMCKLCRALADYRKAKG